MIRIIIALILVACTSETPNPAVVTRRAIDTCLTLANAEPSRVRPQPECGRDVAVFDVFACRWTCVAAEVR